MRKLPKYLRVSRQWTLYWFTEAIQVVAFFVNCMPGSVNVQSVVNKVQRLLFQISDMKSKAQYYQLVEGIFLFSN